MKLKFRRQLEQYAGCPVEAPKNNEGKSHNYYTGQFRKSGTLTGYVI